jgi:membrane-associated phospholipid phosphatase
MSKEIAENTEEKEFGFPLRLVAVFISYFFHPVFIPLYVAYFILYLHPFAFVGFSESEKLKTLIIVALNLVFFPLISVLLLKALGFIDSLFLKTQKDRIIPYIACGIFFFWTYTVFKGQPHYPILWNAYLLSLFIAASVALLANIYFKVSMHAIGVGGWLGYFLYIAFTNSMFMTWPLCLIILITGLVSTARLMLKQHSPFDIYAGLFIGFLSQLAAIKFLL